MRIIGGEYRSRLIEMPKGVRIRPTQDKVRQAVFNILCDVSGKAVLDLFAGSGAFGIEAISRGASHATFVDDDFKCVSVIKTNLKALKADPSLYDIIKGNALNVLPKFEQDGKKFDLIFLDPPYYQGLAKKCLINIDRCDILSPTGSVIAEHSRKDGLTGELKALAPVKERRYGDKLITIYKKI